MTPRIITAAEARALIDGARPGPWQDAGEYDEPADVFDGEGILVASGVWNEGNRALVIAVPDLAATVIAQAADIERLRSIIDGRTTAPSDAEITAHGTAAGRWRWASPDQHGEFPSTARWRASVAVVARVPGVRWWATDSDKRPCAWPVVAEASR